MGRFLLVLLSDFVTTIATVGLMTMVGLLGWLQDIPWYQLALGVIWAFAGSLFLVNQFRAWWPTRRIKDDRWLKEAIILWLTPRFSVKEMPSADAKFHLKVTDAYNRAFSIQKSKQGPSDLRLSFKIVVNEKDQPLADGLDQGYASELIENMRIEMSRLGVLYSNFKLPLRELYVEDYLPIDIQFDRFKVVQHSLVMVRAHALLQVLINRAVRLCGPVQKQDSDKEDSESE